MRNFGGFGRLTPSTHGLLVPGRGVAAGGAAGGGGALAKTLFDYALPQTSLVHYWEPGDTTVASEVKDLGRGNFPVAMQNGIV